ncbi:MAG: RIP metalloprotease RseP [Erysipelotrichaceae bacterium]
MDIIYELFYFVVVLTVIVIVHELGHLIAAKKFNVYCGEFSIGFGPALFKKKFKETTLAIRALPIGGYVQMAGEEDANGEMYDAIPLERCVNGIKPWKQAIIMGAGIFMNIVLALVIFTGINLYNGVIRLPIDEVVVGEVVANSPASKADFKANDKIVGITYSDGTKHPIVDYQDLMEATTAEMGESIYEVERDGKLVSLKLTPEKNPETGTIQAGVIIKAKTKEITMLEAVKYAFIDCVNSVKLITEALLNLFRGVGLENLSGPIGIFKVTSQFSTQGFMAFFNLIAMLSLNLGVFNALPIPILDGGRIFILIIEKIRGKKLSEKFITITMNIGVFAIIALMVFVTWQDIVKLF